MIVVPFIIGLFVLLDIILSMGKGAFFLSDILKRSVLFNIGLILFFITLATTIIYSSTGNRFKK
ncbi:hypothetical protein P9J83_01100 [Clostridium sporogenes]|uniref:Uncharacterized protein n=1 Tax=Clostridium sporogenes TaxID=1509 RepID=A0AAE4FH06_CLOSG|nr:hypothetical protein [Clostridium sporogenes]MDS1002100.1 hypothetical protein [Clostridium sporogenes]